MPQEKISTMQSIGNILTAGGASIGLILGWINQLCMLTIASSGLSTSPLQIYYLPSYYLTIGGVGLFMIGLLLIMSKLSTENRKACIWSIIASILFLVAMGIMFTDIKASEGLKEAAKSAYLIIAIRAGLVFIGLLFFYKAFKKSEIPVKKVWKLVPKISVFLLMLASLLMFIPVMGDIVFGFVYLIIGIILIVCLYPIVMNN